jgi:hypothetical protein
MELTRKKNFFNFSGHPKWTDTLRGGGEPREKSAKSKFKYLYSNQKLIETKKDDTGKIISKFI